MKRTFILILAVICSSTAIAQIPTVEEIKTLLSHKWKFSEWSMGEQKLPPSQKMFNSFLDLKSDGTLVRTEDGQEVHGKWSFENRYLVFKIDGKKKSEKNKLVNITDTELIFRTTEDGIFMTLVYKRVE